jgi:hypothetical protein
MSFSMYILADERLTKDEVFAALEECGMDTSTLVFHDGDLSAYFPLDDDYVAVFSYREKDKSYGDSEYRDVLKSELGFDWLVNSVIYFGYRLTERSDDILAHFFEVLAQKTKASLNYSSALEVPFAVKDEHGLRWFEAASPIRSPGLVELETPPIIAEQKQEAGNKKAWLKRFFAFRD